MAKKRFSRSAVCIGLTLIMAVTPFFSTHAMETAPGSGGSQTVAQEENPAAQQQEVSVPISEGQESSDADKPEKQEDPSAAEQAVPTEKGQQEPDGSDQTDPAETEQPAAEDSDTAEPAQTETEYLAEAEGVTIKAVLSDPEIIPDDAVLTVSPITGKSKGYNYDAYMDALNKDAEAVYNDGNTLLYDIAFMKDGREIQPDGGTVTVTFDFKKDQLVKTLGAEKASDIQIIHLPLKDEVRAKYDTTKAAKAIDEEDIETEPLAAKDVDVDLKKEAVEFELNSFSVITIAGTGEQYTIQDTDADSFTDSKFNVFNTGEFSEMANFGLIGFDTLTINQHIHSNIATENLVVESSEGIGTYKPGSPAEMHYIGTSSTGDEIFTLLQGSQIVLGSDMNVGDVVLGSNEFDLPVDQSTYHVTLKGAGDGLDTALAQERPGQKFIDLAAWKEIAETRSTKYSGFTATRILKKESGSYFHLVEKSTSAVSTINITAEDLISPYGNPLPIRIEDEGTAEKHVLVINLDLKGHTNYEFPGLMWINSDGEIQSGTIGEVNSWTNGNVILNVLDSSQEDNRYRGVMVIGDQTTAMILAPDAEIQAKKNVNGQIIANTIKIYGDGEFHRDTFTFEGAITVKGGLKAAKCVNGDRDVIDYPPFMFELEPEAAVNLAGDTISVLPMPDNATDAEKEAGKMTVENEVDGMILFGYLNFEEEGDYTYLIRESIPEGATQLSDGSKYYDGIVYDTSEYHVTVYARKNANNAIAIQGYKIEKGGQVVDEITYDEGKTGVVEFQNRAASNEFSIQATKSFDGTWPEEGFTFELVDAKIGYDGNEPQPLQSWDQFLSSNGEYQSYGNYVGNGNNIVTVNADDPVADFGMMKGVNGNKKYTFIIRETVTNPDSISEDGKIAVKDGITYDISDHHVVVDITTIEGKTIIQTTYDGKSKLTITNQAEQEAKGSLKVTKKVQYNGAEDSDAAGTFKVGLYKKELLGETFVEAKDISVAGGTGEVTFEDLEVGKTYIIYEMDGDNKVGTGYEYEVSYEGQEAAITETDLNPEATITNNKVETGTITVTKTVQYNGATDTASSATFKVGISENQNPETIPSKDIKSITVSRGEGSVAFEGLTVGQTYYIYEVDADGKPVGTGYEYQVTGSGSEVTIERGDLNKTVDLTNNKNETGKLTVTKKVKYNGADDNTATGTFYAALFKEDGSRFGDVQTISVTNGTGTAEFSGLTVGQTYTLKETDASGKPVSEIEGFAYAVSYEGQSVTATRGDLNQTATITNNKSEQGQITVTKTVKYNGELDTECSANFRVGISQTAVTGDAVIPAADIKNIEVNGGTGNTVFTELTVGQTYYIYEVDANGKPVGTGYEYEVTGSGSEVTIERGDLNKTVDLTNNKNETGKLAVTKKVTYNGADDPTATGTFYAALFKEDGSRFGDVKAISVTDGTGTAEFTGLTVGQIYTLKETTADGTPIEGTTGFEYAVTYDGQSVTATRGDLNQTATITNNKSEKGQITVTKTVKYNGELDTTCNATFRVGISEAETTGAIDTANIKSITVSGGEGSVIFDKLTVGETYYIYEVDADGKPVGEGYEYEVTGSGSSATIERGDLNKTVDLTNNKNETGKLTVTKKVKYNGADDTTAEGTFYAALFKGDERVSNVQTISVTNGIGTAEFSGLTVGQTYTLKETDASGKPVSEIEGFAYAVSYEGQSVTATRGDLNKTATLTNNKSEQGQITVTKTVQYNGELDTECNATFRVGISETETTGAIDTANIKSITVSGGEGSVIFDKLTVGETYYIYEVDADGKPVGDSYASYKVTGSGSSATIERGDLNKIVSLTNNKIETGTITVSKTVKYNGELDTECSETFRVGISQTDNPETIDTASIKEIKVNEGTGSVAFDKLTVGQTYYIYEVDADGKPVGEGFEYEVTGSGTGVTISRGDVNKNVDLTNSKSETGQITVTKTVKYNGELDTTCNATFRVGISETETTGAIDTANIKSITVSGGEGSVIFDKLTVGQTYYIYEVDEDGKPVGNGFEYAVEGNGSSRTIERSELNKEVSLINSKSESGQITVNKTVKYNGATDTECDKTFRAGISQSKDPVSINTADIKEIKVNEGTGSVIFGGLTVGQTYYIYEVDETGAPVGDGFEYEVTGSGSEVTITRDKLNQTVDLTNSKTETGKLTVTKQMQYNGANDAEAEGTFYAALFDADGTIVGGVQEISVSGGTGTAEFTGLTVGATYILKETDESGKPVSDVEGFEYAVTGSGVSKTITRNDLNQTADLTNNKVTGSIILTKIDKISEKGLSGATFDLYKVRTILPDQKINTESLTTNASGQIRVDELEAGEYYFRETEAPEGYITPTGDAAKTDTAVVLPGQSEPQVLTITMTNYKAEGSAELSVTKTLNREAPPEGQFSFVLKDADGEEIGTCANDAAGKVSFEPLNYQLSDLNADGGGTFTYTISEVIPKGAKENADGNYELNGYTYDGHSVTATVTAKDKENGEIETKVKYTGGSVAFANAYAASGEITLTANKTLNGKAPDKGAFSFELLDADGEQIDTADNAADGTVTFKTIEYSLEDMMIDGAAADQKEFTYTIREVIPDGMDGYTFDSHEAKVTVLVTHDKKGSLKAEIKSVDGSLTFTNAYCAEGEITFEGTKTFENGDLTEQAFTFSAYDKDAYEAYQKGETGALPQAVTTATTAGAQPDENGGAAFQFTPIHYTIEDLADAEKNEDGLLTKTFEYIVKEDVPTTADRSGYDAETDIRYDLTEKTVKVTVTDQGDGTLKTELSEDAQEIAFTNAKGHTKLKLTKEIDRFVADGSGEFKTNATFVFLITGTDKETGEKVYSKEASVQFTAADGLSQEVTVDDVPLGLDLDVREIYSGNYESEMTSDGVEKKTDVGGIEYYTVSFKNKAVRSNSGSGIINKFEKNGDSFTIIERIGNYSSTGTLGQ